MSRTVYRNFRRVPAQSAGRGKSRTHAFPAPIRGWISNESLAAAKPLGALILENFFPTQNSIRPRGGSTKVATIDGAVVSMFPYISGSVAKRFAASATAVYDVTSVADVGVAPTPDITSQTAGYYSYAQFATAGGDFLYIVNGSDAAQLYNGSTWAAVTDVSSPVSITGVATTSFSHVWVYRNRLFFIGSGMNAWALPAGAIGGAAIQIALGGVFQRGGRLLTGGSWSQDAGDGMDDRIVFITTEGEVAVFAGSDPADPANWQIQGRYDITPPLGKRAILPIGGDMLILTKEGIVPMSAVTTKDPAALSLAAVTSAIEPDWKREVGRRGALPWEVIKFPAFNMGIVSLPNTSLTQPACLVVNLETGAWAKYTGWDTNCLLLHDDWAYFGTRDGKIMQTEIGGNDDGAIYTCTYVGLPDHLRMPGVTKTVRLGRSTWLSSTPFDPQLSISTDYQITLPAAPNSVENPGGEDLWDIALWDVAKWDATMSEATVSTRWVSIGRTGFVVSPQVQVTFGITLTPGVELITIDLLYESGAVVV